MSARLLQRDLRVTGLSILPFAATVCLASELLRALAELLPAPRPRGRWFGGTHCRDARRREARLREGFEHARDDAGRVLHAVEMRHALARWRVDDVDRLLDDAHARGDGAQD